MDRLGIQPSQLIEGAYLDLLLAQKPEMGSGPIS